MLTDIELRKEVLEKLRENFTKELDENEAEQDEIKKTLIESYYSKELCLCVKEEYDLLISPEQMQLEESQLISKQNILQIKLVVVGKFIKNI